jgi:hypothetical protein
MDTNYYHSANDSLVWEVSDILECLIRKLPTAECISGKWLLSDDDVQWNMQLIPDTSGLCNNIRDKENIDINCMQKYIKAHLHGRFLLRFQLRFSPFGGCEGVDQL